MLLDFHNIFLAIAARPLTFQNYSYASIMPYNMKFEGKKIEIVQE